MKFKSIVFKGIVLILFSVSSLSSHAQQVPSIMARKWVLAALEVTNLNLNYIASKYASTESVRHDCPNAIKACQFKSEIIRTGKKDFEGYEVLHIKMYKDENTKNSDYILFRPEFDYFPLKYNYYIVNKSEMKPLAEQGTIGGFTVHGRYLQAVMVDGEDAFITSGDKDFFLRLKTKFPRYDYTYNAIYDRNHGHFGVLTPEESKQIAEFTESRYQKNVGKLFEAVLDYNKKILESVNGKTYSDLITSFKDGECFMYRGYSIDSLKVSFLKDNAGKVNEIVFHYPFYGGVYSENEKFKLRAKKNANGLFQIIDQNSYIKIPPSIIYPFENRLFFCTNNTSSDEIKILQTLTYDMTDPLPLNLASSNKFYQDKSLHGIGAKFSHYLDSDHTKKDSFFHTWWKRHFEETEYNSNADDRLFKNFFKKYLKAIIK
jgi:hypothetical protein